MPSSAAGGVLFLTSRVNGYAPLARFLQGWGVRARRAEIGALPPAVLTPRPGLIMVDGSCGCAGTESLVSTVLSHPGLSGIPVVVYDGPGPTDPQWARLIASGVRHCLPPGVPHESVLAAVAGAAQESERAEMMRRTVARTWQEKDRDLLTGLATRGSLEKLLSNAPAGSRRAGDDHVGLLMIDVDLFKEINDTHGHAVGDQALAQVGRRLAGLMRAGDLAVRWAGDEFAALLPEADLERAGRVADRLVRAVGDEPLAVLPCGTPVTGSVSVGVAAGPASPTLMLEADRAMYAAKQAGRGCVAMSAGRALMSVSGQQRLSVGRRAEDRARA